ncbi:MAG: Ldh family oxidoreductase [Acidimicrobiales bacterium]
MLINAHDLQAFITDIFAATACSDEEAGKIAANLVEANLKGHDSHGVIRTERYVGWLANGVQLPDQELTVITETPSFAVLDGNYGMGQTVGPLAEKWGRERAEANGVAGVAWRNSGHLGRIGAYAEMAADRGQVSLHLVNVVGGLLVAPFGGRERRMGTNPVCIGTPIEGKDHVILDFATSVVAEGKAYVALKGGKPVPSGSLISSEGKLTDDPAVLYGEPSDDGVRTAAGGSGALRAMGDHKGSGLAMMCELVGGALTGAGTAGPGRQRFCNGMLSVYLSVDAIDTEDDFARLARDYVEYYVGSAPAEGSDEVLTPGEPERRRHADRLANGIEIADDAWESIMAGARLAGLEEASIPHT